MEILSDLNVTIIGLGLMGGSLAMALRGKVRHLYGVEPSTEAAHQAIEMGLVEKIYSLEDALEIGGLVVLAAPVRAILGCLEQMKHRTPSQPVVLLDFGSTKAAICDAMSSLPDIYEPIGGHPMCGKEVSGAAHAEAALFQDKVFVLTPLNRTTQRARRTAEWLVQALGSRMVELDPDLHDRLVAHSSHLPYLSSVGLVLAGDQMADSRLWQVAASGFRDSTRLAGSDLTMMSDILLSNQAAVLEALADFHAALFEMARLLQAGDEDGLCALLAAARTARKGLYLP